jgi:hypothetical protein
MIELLTTYNIIIGVSVVLNLILLIGVRNLLKQNEQLEDRLISSINEIREKISSALDNMRKIDNKQAFEKDDEVGVTFSEMKTIVEQLDNEI